jgi:hypothetical protein
MNPQVPGDDYYSSSNLFPFLFFFFFLFFFHFSLNGSFWYQTFGSNHAKLGLINTLSCVHRFVIRVVHYTSRKRDKKELQPFFHCGLFDHPDLQSLNNCKFVFLVYQVKF